MEDLWGTREGRLGDPRKTLGGPSEDPWGTLALEGSMGPTLVGLFGGPWWTLDGPLGDPWRTLFLDEHSILSTRGALFRTRRKRILTVYAWCVAPHEAQVNTACVWCVVPHDAQAMMTTTKDDTRRVHPPSLKSRSPESRSAPGGQLLNVGSFGPFLAPHGLGTRGNRFLGPVSPPVHLSGGRWTQIGPSRGPFVGFGPPFKGDRPYK